MIKNIQYECYIALDLDQRLYYDKTIKYSKTFKEPVNNFNIPSFDELTFIEVKDLQFEFEHENDKEIELWLQKKANIKLAKVNILELFQQLAWLKSEVERINEIESENLGYTPDGDEVRADIDRFNKYGHYPQIVSIAKDLGISMNEVKAMRYSEAFMHLLYMHDCSEYERDINKIKMQSHK